MTTVYVVRSGEQVSAAFSTRSKALNLVRAITVRFGRTAAPEVVALVVDDLDSRLASGNTPWRVSFPDVSTNADASVVQDEFSRGTAGQDSFQYDSASGQFRVLVWAANQAEALARARTVRANFYNRLTA